MTKSEVSNVGMKNLSHKEQSQTELYDSTPGSGRLQSEISYKTERGLRPARTILVSNLLAWNLYCLLVVHLVFLQLVVDHIHFLFSHKFHRQDMIHLC